MYKKTDLLYSVLHLPFDAAALFLAFITSYWLRGNGLEIYRLPFNDYLSLIYPAIALWLLVFALQRLYTKRYLFGTLQNISPLAMASLAGWATFVVYLVFLKTEQTFVFPRLMLVYILVFSFLFVFIGRLALRFLQFIMRTLGIGRTRLMVLGTGKVAETLEHALLERSDPSVNFIKRVEAVETEELVKLLKKYNIHELVISDHTLSDSRVLEYIIGAQNAGVACHLVPNMFEVQASNVLFSTLVGTPILTFRQTPLDGWGRISKRLFDIVGSFLGIILLSPLFLLVALAVTLTSRGPILFSQQRIGRDGKHFKMFKFRSMFTHLTGDHVKGKTELEIFRDMGREDLVEEYKTNHKVKVDPRITPVGRVLRKTRLDELPQLFNVLRGDLSLVGPRAIRDFELSRYGKWQSYLLSIKPGLTGLWQVSGGNDVTYEERVQLDSHYVQNWSLWQDLVIILKTFTTILRGGDGY